jgi:PIN domain nuclease of toxin-antitoxin system
MHRCRRICLAPSTVKILLDTQSWLWMVASPERLSVEGRARVTAPESELFLSAASSWEIAIKYSLGRLRLPASPAEYLNRLFVQTRTSPLPVNQHHALRVVDLPMHHRDPFDRMLIAQAQLESLPIMTSDPRFHAYDVEVLAT